MTYKDKNGKELKIGDLVFYTERPRSNYADSLQVVVRHNQHKLGLIHLVGNNGTYFLTSGDSCSLEHNERSHEDPSICLDVVILDDVSEGEDLLEYMNKKFPLSV